MDYNWNNIAAVLLFVVSINLSGANEIRGLVPVAPVVPTPIKTLAELAQDAIFKNEKLCDEIGQALSNKSERPPSELDSGLSLLLEEKAERIIQQLYPIPVCITHKIFSICSPVESVSVGAGDKIVIGASPFIYLLSNQYKGLKKFLIENRGEPISGICAIGSFLSSNALWLVCTNGLVCNEIYLEKENYNDTNQGFRLEEEILGSVMSKDESLILFTKNKIHKIQNLRQNGDLTKETWDIQYYKVPTCLASKCLASKNEESIYGGCADGTIMMWNIKEGSITLEYCAGYSSAISSIAVIGECNNKIIIGHDDGRLSLFNCKDIKVPIYFKEQHSDAILCIALDHLGSIITGSKDCTVRMWDQQAMQCKNIVSGFGNPVKAVAVGYNGYIFAGSAGGEISAWTSNLLSQEQKIQAAILVKAQERENKKRQQNELSEQQKTTILRAIGYE